MRTVTLASGAVMDIFERLYQAGLYRGRAAASGPAHDEPRWHPSDGLDSDPEAREHYSAGWRAGRAWRAESATVRAIEGA